MNCPSVTASECQSEHACSPWLLTVTHLNAQHAASEASSKRSLPPEPEDASLLPSTVPSRCLEVSRLKGTLWALTMSKSQRGQDSPKVSQAVSHPEPSSSCHPHLKSAQNGALLDQVCLRSGQISFYKIRVCSLVKTESQTFTTVLY